MLQITLQMVKIILMTIRVAIFAFLISFAAITGWLMTRKPADIHFTSPPSGTAQTEEKKTTTPADENLLAEDEIIALSSGEQYLREKLKGIIIPEITFENTSVEEALDYIRLRARELDPSDDDSRKGIGFIIRKPSTVGDADWDSLDAEASTPGQDFPTVTGTLKNKNLSEVLDFICTQANLRWELTEHKIMLTPLD